MKAYTQGIGAYGSDPITVLNKTYNYKVLFEIISLKIITNMEKLEVNEYWLDEICTVKFLEDIEFYRVNLLVIFFTWYFKNQITLFIFKYTVLCKNVAAFTIKTESSLKVCHLEFSKKKKLNTI